MCVGRIFLLYILEALSWRDIYDFMLAYVCWHVCMCVYAFMNVCIYVSLFACICVYTCMYVLQRNHPKYHIFPRMQARLECTEMKKRSFQKHFPQ